MILIFSTSRRYNFFEMTFKSLIAQSPDIQDLVDKVYILDDRSTWGDRHAMENDVSSVFGSNKVTTLAFNNGDEFGWVDKLNFISKLADDTDYFMIVEDDWEFIKPTNLMKHINFMVFNDDIDLITFNGWWKMQIQPEGAVHECVPCDKKRWDSCYDSDYNETYWSNPHPKGYRHVIKEVDGAKHWVGVRLDNFSMNPGIFRSSMFKNNKFEKNDKWEVNFATGKNFKQLFLKEGTVIHRGEDDTLFDRKKYDGINLK
jgi:hypothetical protein